MDDSLSGTTAVALYLEGRDMWVANVGDSRAIVVQEHEGKLVARPLSSDQTPYRKVSYVAWRGKRNQTRFGAE